MALRSCFILTRMLPPLARSLGYKFVLDGIDDERTNHSQSQKSKFSVPRNHGSTSRTQLCTFSSLSDFASKHNIRGKCLIFHFPLLLAVNATLTVRPLHNCHSNLVGLLEDTD
jgi:hypothetical protein